MLWFYWLYTAMCIVHEFSKILTQKLAYVDFELEISDLKKPTLYTIFRMRNTGRGKQAAVMRRNCKPSYLLKSP